MPGEGVGLGTIDGDVFLEVEFMEFFLGDKSYPPHIRCFDADQDRFVEFSFVAGEGFEEIFDGGIDELDARCPFQEFVGEVDQPADDEGGGNISYNEGDGDKNNKS